MTKNQLFKFAKENDFRVNLKDKKIVWIWVKFPICDKDEQGNDIEETKRFFRKCYPMYNISQFPKILENCEKLPKITKIELPDEKKFSKDEQELINKAFNFKDAPSLEFIYKNSPPCYKHTKCFSVHKIEMQKFSQWKNFESMFYVLLHELGHSTMKGHRKIYKNKGAEELFAESFALFSSVLFNINADEENTLSYIKGWFSEMRNNKNKAFDIFKKAMTVAKSLYMS